MLYKSTRGKAKYVPSAQAIKNGIAEDGGLYMPESIPSLSIEDIRALCPLSYPERAAKILALFLDDYDKDDLVLDCKAAYSSENFSNGVAPLVFLDDKIRVLELWHGPTCAFKDVALQIMPRLLSRALVMTGEKRRALILVATSGDTGKAALEGYKDVPHTAITVFYPANGVSRAQKAQMITQDGANVNVCAINGNFDDAQTGVKNIFADGELADRLSKKGVFLSSANSINWGRLVPQIIYYISAYCDMIEKDDISLGDTIDICVPTGNFGNILAAYIAKKMGLPVRKLICASNENNVLTDFLQSGTYDKNRIFHNTLSPSMDILISSNLERLISLAAGEEKCSMYMNALSKHGKYTVEPQILELIQKDFEGYYCPEQACLDTIKKCYREHSYLIDTHTAVALYCSDFGKREGTKTLVVSTASPYKFAPAVAKALGLCDKGGDTELFERICELTKVPIPSPLSSVFKKKVRFDEVIDKDSMKDAILRFTESLA